MEIICVDDKEVEKSVNNILLQPFEVNLTEGKIYLGMDFEDGYHICDDKNEWKTYRKNRFVKFSRYKLMLRKKKLERIYK